jgi:photosystem II stability/assembly factor-like uncharacterized protein
MGDWNSFPVQQSPLHPVFITLLVSGVFLCSACTQTPQASDDWVVVAAYDFNDYATTDWRFLGPGWRMLTTQEGQVLEGHGPSSALHPLHLREPQITLHVRLVEGSVTVGFLANIGAIVADIGLGHSHGDAGHAHGPFGHATLPIGRLQEELEGYALRVEPDRLVLSTTPIASGATISDVPFAFGLDTPHRLDIDIRDGPLLENSASRTIRVRVDESIVIEAEHDVALCVLDDSCAMVQSPTETTPVGNTMGPAVYRGVYIEPAADSIVHIDNTRLAVQGDPSLHFEQTGIMNGGGATAMTFSRTEPDTVYLITGYNALGAWRSTDGGQTWQRFYQGLHLTSLVLDTEFPEHVLIGDNLGQIIRSTNHGLSWDIVAGAPLDLGEFEEGYAPTIQGMVADPLDATRFYAASSEGRFLVSSDRGSNWEAINTDYPDATSLAIDRGGSNTLYVGTTEGVWRSMDEGQTWEPTSALPGITMSVATQPGSAGVVMAGTTEGLFHSSDSGGSWLQRSDGLSYDDITVLEWSDADPDTVLAGTYKGIFISRDGGTSWQSRNDGLSNTDTGAIAASPTDADHFVSATADWWFNLKPGEHTHFQGPKHAIPGTFMTTNGGESWASLSASYQDRDAYALAVDPAEPTTVYVGTMCSRGLFRSDNLGATFTHLPALASHYTMRIEVSPWDGRTVYMTTAFGIHRSKDEGATWLDLIQGGHFHGLAVAPDQTIYAGTAPAEGGAAGGGGRSGTVNGLDLDGAHVFRSDDGGETWSNLTEGLPDEDNAASAINTIVVAPSDPSIVYLASDEVHGMNPSQIAEPMGVFRSDNRGTNWTQRNDGLPAKAVADMAVDANNPERIFAATRLGLARSSDGGVSWTRVLPERSTAVSVGDDGLVVVGAYGIVAVSTDNGDTWREVHGNLGGHAVWDVVIVPAHNVVLAGVRDRGLMRIKLSSVTATLP